MIQPYSLRLLEMTLNAALSLDEYTPRQLEKFEAKVIQICIKPLQRSFFISFSKGRLILTLESDTPPDTIIHATPIGLIRLSLLPASKARSLFHDGVSMEGDVQLGQQFKQVMDEIDIDWEGHLARFTGDRVAYQLGLGVRKVHHVVQDIQSSLAFQLQSYLQEEEMMVPTSEAVRDFCDDVHQLVLDVDRLEAKIKAGCRKV